MAMRTSAAGQATLKTREGKGLQPVLKAMQDQRGIWTIGFGTIRYPNGVQVKSGDTCTPAQAQVWFLYDLGKHEATVNAFVKVPLTQSQFDALVSFDYNEGDLNFETSTLLQLLNSGQYHAAAAQFPVWNKVRINGVLTVDKGLINRRAAEQEQFLSGTSSAQDAR